MSWYYAPMSDFLSPEREHLMLKPVGAHLNKTRHYVRGVQV